MMGGAPGVNKTVMPIIIGEENVYNIHVYHECID